MESFFYDKKGNLITVGDKVTCDEQPGKPFNVLAFKCGLGEDVQVYLNDWDDPQPATKLARWKPQRTWQEVAQIVLGPNELIFNNEGSIYI